MEQEKISDLIIKSRQRKTKLVSFEVYPDNSLKLDSLNNLFKDASFISITWKVPPSVLSNIDMKNVSTLPSISLAHHISKIGHTVLLHLTCIGMKKNTLLCILEYLKTISLKNLLILQGDGFDKNYEEEFDHASDMIQFIRQNYKDFFCLGVAGFPRGNPSSRDLDEDIKYIKLKVDQGADFIITQMFYNVLEFTNFVKICRSARIEVPIIPGLCIFPSYNVLQKMTELTQISVPEELQKQIEVATSDSSLFVNIIFKFITNLVNELLKNETIFPGIHWFLFNHFQTISDVMEIFPVVQD